MKGLCCSVAWFQYRKRYGPVATYVGNPQSEMGQRVSIPQAVIPCCNRLSRHSAVSGEIPVSIPQAVWPSCNWQINQTCSRCCCGIRFNTASGITQLQLFSREFNQAAVSGTFQYRKRYYPVATKSGLMKGQNVY